MERTNDLLRLFQGGNVKDDEGVRATGQIKELFTCVRELLFVGFKKFNPVETLQEIGDILDDYNDEATSEEKRGILDLFTKLTEELMAEGFLVDLLEAIGEAAQKKTAKTKVAKK